MTHLQINQINSAIAQILGWTEIQLSCIPVPMGITTGLGLVGRAPNIMDFRGVPNYYGNLNACLEFEQTLIGTQKLDYLYALGLEEHESPPCPLAFEPSSVIKVFFATAPQRCEAFLRTLGKWEETK
jgi:hypothetical protein